MLRIACDELHSSYLFFLGKTDKRKREMRVKREERKGEKEKNP